MTEMQPSHWTHHRQAYAATLARWSGDDAAIDALSPEARSIVIRALIDKSDLQRGLTEQPRADYLDDWAAAINAATTLDRLDAELAAHPAPDFGETEPGETEPGGRD